MHEDITDRIKQYLELDTNYAIIINGDYGIGKTHYIKNQLFPKITEFKTHSKKDKIYTILFKVFKFKMFKTHSKKNESYIPIFISLFGAKSIEDIQNQIFIALYPVLKHKSVKILASLGNIGLQCLIRTTLKDLLSKIGISSKSLTDYRKILICIDDIDRKSTELDLKEIFGFVNNLVENSNAKILLIANEDELEKGVNTDNYSLLREKVIGISLSFKTNVSLIFDSIIKTKYKSENKQYFDFLTQHKKNIVKRILQNKDNLRNLLFFLEHFKIIFDETTDYLSKESKFDTIKDVVFEKILNFTLPISIEYKMGRLNTKNSSEIKEAYQGILFDFFSFNENANKEEEPKPYSQLFKEKYLLDGNTQERYFDSIFNYITGETSFQIKQLSRELNLLYKFENNTIPEREKIISKLSSWGFVDLKYSEYRSLIFLLLKYVDKGEFSLEQYSTVFYYITRFKNPLNYNIENLKKRFKKGIRKGKDNYQYVDNLDFQLSVDSTSEFQAEIKEIKEYCIKINKEIEERQKLKKITTIFDLFSSDFNAFLEKVQDINSEFMFIPYFKKYDFNKIWRIIKQLDNSQIMKLTSYFRKRYPENLYKEIYSEKQFLKDLNKEVENLISQETTDKLKKITLEFFKKQIKESIENFSESTHANNVKKK